MVISLVCVCVCVCVCVPQSLSLSLAPMGEIPFDTATDGISLRLSLSRVAHYCSHCDSSDGRTENIVLQMGRRSEANPERIILWRTWVLVQTGR